MGFLSFSFFRREGDSPMIRRLRIKLITITMVLAMSMLMVIFSFVYHYSATSLRESSESALKAVATASHRPGRPGNFTPDTTVLCFTLELSPIGNLICTGGEFYDLSDQAMLWDIWALVQEEDSLTGTLSEYSLRFYGVNTPTGIRYAFTDTTGEESSLNRLVTSFLLIGFLMFWGFLGISILLANWFIKPVAQAWQQQRQFVDDASHELKTPLTVILTNAELLNAPDFSAQERQKFSDSILTTARQMRGLVENMLDLARVENGRVTAQLQPVDLSELVEDTVLSFEAVYYEKDLFLESQFQPGIFVKGNPQYLRQVLGILLDNGQKYSTPGGTVRVALTQHGKGKCLISVITPGKPLTDRECIDIFKRFYRVDQVRTSSGSYGLGLAIAQRIVREHGGKIWAQGLSESNGFYILLPES